MTSSRQPYRPEAMLKIGWRRKWHILVPAVVVAAAASWWIHRLPDRHRGDALLLVVPQRVPETFVRSTVTARLADRLQAITQQILTRAQLERIVREFDLYPTQRANRAIQDVVEAMRARDIDVRPVKGDAFRLGFIADRPDVPVRVVARPSSLFLCQTPLHRATLAEGADQFLEGQLEDARRKLVENETRLEEY